jgi:YD repeat-containing protein
MRARVVSGFVRLLTVVFGLTAFAGFLPDDLQPFAVVSAQTVPSSVTITANGQGDPLTLSPGSPLQIAIAGDGGTQGFANPSTMYVGVYVQSVFLWLTPSPAPLHFEPEVTPFYQGPLGTFASTLVLNFQSGLPVGTYTWFILVNGANGLIGDSVLTTVTVTVTPSIASLTPNTGHISEPITIIGSDFGGSPGIVTFNGIAATETSPWTDTSISANVPADATTGDVVVIVDNVASNGVPFTVIPPPTITSVSTGSAQINESVTIVGTDFGEPGTSTLKFNGLAATPTIWTDGSITAPVPVGATSGDITVTVWNQTSNGVPFTVLSGVLSTVYHFHSEPSSTPGLLQLKAAGPDNAGAAFQSADLINSGPASGVIQAFDTQAGDPGVAGLIPAGSTFQFILWMRKTSAFGVVLPQASIRLNSTSGPTLCQATGSNPNQALTTTLTTPFAMSCQTTADVVLTPTDRVWLSAGYNVIQGPGDNGMKVELRVEGTLNGPTDSAVVTPSLVTTLIVTKVNPVEAPVNTSVVLSGFGFGNSPGSSTVSFNGTAATSSSWSNATIAVPVPAGATSGPIVITVNGSPSNGMPFTVIPPPVLTSVSPSTAHINDSVTITGNNFLNAPGSSVVAFHGTPSTPTDWNNTSISVPVPAGATTGDLIVTVSNQASNSLPFTVLQPTTIIGTITRVTGGTAVAGATVQALQAGAMIGSTSTAANGTYSIPAFYPGTYEIRVFASGFSSELRQGVSAALPTTTVNIALYAPGTLSGKVTQADGLTPISGAAVTVYSGPVQQGASQTNATGDYTIAALHPGSYTAQAANVGYSTSEQSVVVSEAATTTKNFSLNAAPSGPVQYAYDALGRLVQVTDPSGQPAIYRYDAVGNIVAIERPGTTGVAISAFTPGSGVIGTDVAISGTGFSTTPSQNSVTFQGVPAAVTTATATQLVTTVPAGATTGPIAVATSAGSAATSTPFTVLTSSGAPAVSGFSPGIGVAGTALTVSGTNFDAITTHNNLTLNVSPAQVESATSTVIQSTIPPSTSTGRVSVATPNGIGISSSYLWVVPAPYAVADVESTGVLTLGAATPVTVTGANKIALRAFEGIEGHRAFVNVTDAPAGVYLYAYDPLGNLFATSYAADLETPILRRTATYSLVFDPFTTGATSATLTVYDVPPDVSGTIVAGGAAVPLFIDIPGRNGVLTFTGTASQRVSLVISDGMMTGGCTDVSIRKAAPDETVLISNPCIGNSGFLDTITLPSAGTYRVVVNPSNANIGSLTFILNDVPADFTGTITPGGSAVPVSTMSPGQNAVLTFSGMAGQVIYLQFSNYAYGSNGLFASILQDTSVLMGATFVGANGSLSQHTLPVAGTYTITLDPWSSATGSIDVALVVPP